MENQDFKELFNPGEFTEKELLKLVYRELHQLKEDFEHYKNTNDYNNRIQTLQLALATVEGRVEMEKQLRESGHKVNQRILAIGGFIVITIELVLKIFHLG